ncbi:electron transfer flavoprotein subunit beta/FixA family protein [soil metagenome]
MKILVLVKEVPDTYGDRVLDATTRTIDRGASEAVTDEINERALEVALQYKDSTKDAEVVLLSMSPPSATTNLRKGLAMGATAAVHLVDDSLAGSDALTTARALAAALTQEGFDVVIGGNESTDGRGGVVPAMIAELLGLPHATSIGNVELTATSVSGDRTTEFGTVSVRAALPAVISVTEQAPEARFPNFKGIMGAKKKPLRTVTRGELGFDAGAARSSVLSIDKRPGRTAGTKIVDEGNAGVRLAEYLAAERLI